jgi:hypothetical protein
MAFTTLCPIVDATQLAAGTGLAHIAQYLYYTKSLPGMIWVADLDGGTWELMRGLPHPQGVAVDASLNAIFWSDDAGIHRANLDGSNPRLLYETHADVLALGT